MAAPRGETPNPRGIPLAPFIENVDEYIAAGLGSTGAAAKRTTTAGAAEEEVGSAVEAAMRKFQELISKYQFMEASTTRRLSGLREKLPDIDRTLEMVTYLVSQPGSASNNDDDGDDDDDQPTQPVQATFELNDTLFAHATVDRSACGPDGEVFLWLGANVMLAYPASEAKELLTARLEAAKTSVANCEEDLDFLREQITTLEVAIARVYNWDVIRRRNLNQGGGGAQGKQTAISAK